MPETGPDSSSIEPLPSNPARQAVDTLGGYDYQIWTSIEAWLLLGGDEVIYLEGAEDIDRVGASGATTVQVKRTAGTISLNVEVVRDAIKNFWATVEGAPTRVVRFAYLTTSTVAMEQNAAFDGMKGIVAWEKAAHDVQLAELVRTYLVNRLGAEGTLQAFLTTTSVEELQAKLFSRFTWLTGQPPVDVVKASVTQRLEDWCDAEGLSRQTAAKLRDTVFARCWEQVLKPRLADRRLDAQLLASAKDEATSFVLKLPLSTAQGLMQILAQLPALQRQLTPFAILQQPVPPLPGEIVERPALIAALQIHLNRREPVFLSGSAFKGKTTLAMVVAHRAMGAAQWIDLAGREPAATADIFNLVSLSLDATSGSALVVFDDLDTNARSRKVYASALRQMLHRAKLAGKAVLFTAQGQSEALATEVANDWGLVMLDVPPLTEEEVQALCVDLGCPPGSLAKGYGTLIAAQTAGQPRLAQVRVLELASHGWPKVSMETLLGNSQAVRTAKQAARELFEASVSAPEAAFVYEAAEFTYAPSRAMLLRLANLPPTLAGASTVLDRLNGRWIEAATGDRCKVTPILKGEVNITWTLEQLRAVHGKLFDAIVESGPFTPADGAAMMFHAFFSLEGSRIARAAAIIIGAEGLAAEQIHAHLGWIVHVAVEPGMQLLGIGSAYVAFRTVQLRTAAQESMDTVPAVIAAWRRDIEADVANPVEQVRAQLLMNMSILINQAPFPFAVILEAVADLYRTTPNLDDDVKAAMEQGTHAVADRDIPTGASLVQTLLATRAGSVRSIADLKALFAWIDRSGDEPLLAEFDAVAGWPIVRSVGSFVHWAWANEARSSDPEWPTWISALDEGMAIVARKRMAALGGELSRAKSIILSEYMRDFAAAEAALTEAKAVFGDSTVLSEQWVNLHYHAKDYAKADHAWQALVQKFGKATIEDPFAFRRAAVCAGKLGQFKRAADLFEEASTMIEHAMPMPTKLGLLGDAAYCAWQAGERRRACRLLTEVALQLPEGARNQSDLKLQHTVVDLNRVARLLLVDGRGQVDVKPISYELGQASSPQTRSEEGVSNQASAARIFEAQVGILEAQWPDASEPLMARVLDLSAGTDPLARLTAAQARIARGMVEGFEAELVEGIAALIAGFDAQGTSKGLTRPDYDVIRIAFLVLGLCCAANPAAAMMAWNKSDAVSRDEAMRKFIASAGAGFAAAPPRVQELVFGDVNGADAGERVGAAVRLLHHNYAEAKLVAQVQGHLVPTLVMAFKTLHFDSLDYPLVIRWAAQWQVQLTRAARFTTAPANAAELHDLLARSRQGRVTLAEFLSVTGRLVGLDQSTFVMMLREPLQAFVGRPQGDASQA